MPRPHRTKRLSLLKFPPITPAVEPSAAPAISPLTAEERAEVQSIVLKLMPLATEFAITEVLNQRAARKGGA
jgi:hypothetical protein